MDLFPWHFKAFAKKHKTFSPGELEDMKKIDINSKEAGVFIFIMIYLS